MHILQIEYLSPDAIKPNPRNPRRHPAKQIRQLKGSLQKFGFNVPILVDADGMILAGHGRLIAAKELGLESVPVIRAQHMSAAQAKAYAIADNRLTENAKWDKQLLGEIFIELQEIEIDFDLEITGFDIGDIAVLTENCATGDEESAHADTEDPDLLAPSNNTICKPGGLWLLGGHRLYCGSALEHSAYEAVMGGEKVQMVFADPPYNVPIQGHVSGLGKTSHVEFAMGCGEMDSAQFTTFLANAMQHCCAFSVSGSLHYWCMDWRHDLEMRQASLQHYHEHKNTCVWVKDNGGMGTLYRSQHEFVFVFKHGKAKHINNVKLGEYGRYRTNVWEYAGYNSFARESDGEGNLLQAHPTVKPVDLVADAIKDCTHKGHHVLDPFAGSGSTLIAAEKTGRICHAIELDPRYCDTIIRRWQALTGKQATHAVTGEGFAEERAKEEEVE